MSWRDRDWARLNDDERRRLFGASATRDVSRRRQRIGEWTLAAIVATGAGLWAIDHVHLSASHVDVQPAIALSRAVAQPQANVIGIRWRPRDLAPAASAGRICVAASRYGRICASYVVGERPADNLTRELERRGLRVQSSG